MPKFSIIIPVYNVAPYLRECLDSVLAQTFTDWEAICVDDGSTDGSGAILDEYAAKDERFRVIHQANAGVSVARNAGLDVASGKWVTFIDGDDTVESNWLQSFAEVDVEDVDLILNSVRQSDGTVRCKNESQERGVLITGDEIARHRMLQKNFAVARCFLRETIEINQIRFPMDISFSEDMVFCFEYMLYVQRASFAVGSWYNYRVVAGSAARRIQHYEIYKRAAEVTRGLAARIAREKNVPVAYAVRIQAGTYLGHMAMAINSCVVHKDPVHSFFECIDAYFSDVKLLRARLKEYRPLKRLFMCVMLYSPCFLRYAFARNKRLRMAF